MLDLASLIELLESIGGAFAMFYLVALGHSIFEKSGILDLAIDGVFFMSTGVAVYGAIAYGSPVAGSVMAILVSSLFGIFMAYVLTIFPVSHGAVGLSLQFLCYGIGIVMGYPLRITIGPLYAYAYPIEMVVEILILVIALGISVYFLLERTKLGAAIRACGENPHAALSLGVNVLYTRIIAAAMGFALVGFGASLFPLLWVRFWDIKTYTLGYGWLAFAIALAAGRHPLFLKPMALIFGGLIASSMRIQTALKIPVDFANLIPFACALVAMGIYSVTGLKRIFAPPQNLGKPFYKEEKTI